MLGQEELGGNHIPSLVFDRSGPGTRELGEPLLYAGEDHEADPPGRYAKVRAMLKAKEMPIFHYPCDEDLIQPCHCEEQKAVLLQDGKKPCFKRA